MQTCACVVKLNSVLEVIPERRRTQHLCKLSMDFLIYGCQKSIPGTLFLAAFPYFLSLPEICIQNALNLTPQNVPIVLTSTDGVDPESYSFAHTRTKLDTETKCALHSDSPHLMDVFDVYVQSWQALHVFSRKHLIIKAHILCVLEPVVG